MSNHPRSSAGDDVSQPLSSHHITALVHQLVGKLVPTDEAKHNKLAQYALRIIGSRLPPSPISDEYALVSLMKKHCALSHFWRTLPAKETLNRLLLPSTHLF